MLQLAESISTHGYSPETMQQLAREIKWAMRPFKANEITAYVDPDPAAFGIWKIMIGVRTLPGVWFNHTVELRDLQAMRYPDDFARALGHEAGEFFRNYRIEPGDNVQLGEG